MTTSACFNIKWGFYFPIKFQSHKFIKYRKTLCFVLCHKESKTIKEGKPKFRPAEAIKQAGPKRRPCHKVGQIRLMRPANILEYAKKITIIWKLISMPINARFLLHLLTDLSKDNKIRNWHNVINSQLQLYI